MFRSVVILHDITQSKQANIEKPLKVMALACYQHDLCQLHIEGSDAELACMVFTDFINDHFTMVNTAHKSNKLTNIHLLKQLPTFSLDFHISYMHKQNCHAKTKQEALQIAIQAITSSNPTLVTEQFKRRETTSTTAIGNGVALPHIMSEAIDTPTLSIVSLNQPLNWGSDKLGEVSLIIAIALPNKPSMPMLKAFSNLTRSLIDKELCQLLTSSTESQSLKAILTHKLAQG